MRRQIEFFDTTNRDGEQATSGAIYGVQSKLEICEMLTAAGFQRIEAGFPYSSQGDFEAVREIARQIHGPIIFGLARVPIAGKESKNPYADIERAFEAVQYAQKPGIHTFSVLFDPDSRKEFGLSKEEIVDGAVMGVARARQLVGPSGEVEFSFQNAMMSPLEEITEGYLRVIEAGANVINVPDTVGYALPDEVFGIIRALRKAVPPHAKISVHCHDDLGNATANAVKGILAGADIVEGTVNGIGERAGNSAHEEVAMNIITRPDMFPDVSIGIDTRYFGHLSKLVEFHYSMPVPDNKAVVGSGAFRHRSGIHQDGMTRGGRYEIMSPSTVGWNGETFDLTSRSGYKGVGVRMRRLGYDISDGDVRDKIMPEFKKLADEVRTSITDLDLVVLYDSAFQPSEKPFIFEEMTISNTDGGKYLANVGIRFGNEIRWSGEKKENGHKNKVITQSGGNGEFHGAVDTIFSAVDSLIPDCGYHLVSYTTRNIGIEKSATAEVTVVLSKDPAFDGKIQPLEGMVIGRARHPDTLRASALAYVDARSKVYPV